MTTTTADATTEGLWDRARAGDRAAAEALFARAVEGLRTFVRLRLGPALAERVEVEDVVQETWVETLRSLGSFEPRGEGSFSRWLCRIAENRIRALADHHGAQKRGAGARPERVSRWQELLAKSASGPASALVREEERARLSSAVGALDALEREILLLRFFQGYTIEEVARLLDRSPSAVRRALGTAVRQVGVALEGPA